jgi:cytochrome P450
VTRPARASVLDTLRTVLVVLVPMMARGVIVRRPRMMALAERLDVDRRAVALMGELRERYGAGPLRLRLPKRSVVLVLGPDDLRRVLDGTPEPFATANREKRAALSHFQPDGVLISHGRARAERRRFNERVLDTDRGMHRLAENMVSTVGEEAERLLRATAGDDSLGWDEFAAAWWRLVRRVVLGDTAADDQRLIDVLTALRRDANWAYLRPRRRTLREDLMRRLRAHLQRAEPGSLAGLIAAMPETDGIAPESQVLHWLFAFDAAGMVTWQTLGLLASHPEHVALARAELAGRDLPYLRACVLDAVRLWPTTLVVLRDSTAETRWDGGTLPAGTAFAAISSYFHRDPSLTGHADRFAPRTWLAGDTSAIRGARDPGGTDGPWPLIPFSAGPAICPGRNVVLLLASTLLAMLLRRCEFRLSEPSRLGPDHPLPGTLNPFRLRFEVGQLHGE